MNFHADNTLDIVPSGIVCAIVSDARREVVSRTSLIEDWVLDDARDLRAKGLSVGEVAAAVLPATGYKNHRSAVASLRRKLNGGTHAGPKDTEIGREADS